jgi:hypothetical protein
VATVDELTKEDRREKHLTARIAKETQRAQRNTRSLCGLCVSFARRAGAKLCFVPVISFRLWRNEGVVHVRGIIPMVNRLYFIRISNATLSF